MKISEVKIDHAVANTIEHSLECQNWLLKGGRFARYAGLARLLVDEQRLARPNARHWWKHWWAMLPDGSQSETDIFLVFEAFGQNFAIHIENKPAHGKISFEQAAGYRRRAIFNANKKGWLYYVDFETILLAPQKFITANNLCSQQFDRSVSYEAMAQFVPLLSLVVD